MINCKKCNKEFEPIKGLLNFCSLACRNSRTWSKEDKLKKAESARQSDKVKQSSKTRIKRSTNTYKKIRIEWKCPVCDTSIFLPKHQYSSRKYCSGTCRNKVNNMLYTGIVSKAEKFLRKELINNFPNLEILSNDRLILNGLELDFYIPSLKIGIEWNGIYHYKDIHKDGSYEKIIENDKKKILICKEKNIELIIVKDLLSSMKHIKEQINLIITRIDGRMV